MLVKKLGQPVPDSYFISEVKSGRPQPAQTNTPARFSSLSALVPARSVPSSRSTRNASAGRRFRHRWGTQASRRRRLAGPAGSSKAGSNSAGTPAARRNAGHSDRQTRLPKRRARQQRKSVSSSTWQPPVWWPRHLTRSGSSSEPIKCNICNSMLISRSWEEAMPRILVSLLIAFCGAGASAQAAYPSKPLTMVVPFPPGGVADIVGRPLAAGMNHALKQPVVVINRTGAGGAVGMASVARAAADGYTLLMSLSSISIFPVSDRINGKPPAYELKDFAPVALVTADPTVLVVRADSRYKTLKDFVDAAQA